MYIYIRICSIHYKYLFNQSFIDFDVQLFYRNRHPLEWNLGLPSLKLTYTLDGRNPANKFTYIDMLNIPLFTRFFIHPRWWIYRWISEPSTVEHLNHPGWKIMNFGPDFFLSPKTACSESFFGLGKFFQVAHLVFFTTSFTSFKDAFTTSNTKISGLELISWGAPDPLHPTKNYHQKPEVFEALKIRKIPMLVPSIRGVSKGYIFWPHSGQHLLLESMDRWMAIQSRQWGWS